MIGEKELVVLELVGALEGMLPSNLFLIESQAEILVYDLEISFRHVEAVNAGMRLSVQMDAIYNDHQYEDDPIVLSKGP